MSVLEYLKSIHGHKSSSSSTENDGSHENCNDLENEVNSDFEDENLDTDSSDTEQEGCDFEDDDLDYNYKEKLSNRHIDWQSLRPTLISNILKATTVGSKTKHVMPTYSAILQLIFANHAFVSRLSVIFTLTSITD